MTARPRQPLRGPNGVSTLLDRPRLAAAIAIVAGVLILTNLLHISLWQCPIISATGVPCPGCGMTRASKHLLLGNFSQSLQYNPLILFLLPYALLTTVGLIGPRRWRVAYRRKTRQIEYHYPWIWLAIPLIVLFQLTRIIAAL